jgi:hypothetical protein
MDDTNKKLCKEFESEMWLFIDHSMEKDRKKFWQNHLADCSDCSSLLKTSKETIEQYNQVPLDKLSDDSYEKIISTITADNERTEHHVISIKENRSLFEIFGFYKLAFGGTVLAAALAIIFVTFFNNPELPEIKTIISEELLAWDFPGFRTETANKQNQIISLKTDGWDIYIVRKNNKEDWGSALRSIQKQIRKMKKEVYTTSM